jgi:hypothetical protein
MRQVLHSDHRLMRKTVSFDTTPSAAPTGHRKRQYALRMKTVVMSRAPSATQSAGVAWKPNIQNGSM